MRAPRLTSADIDFGTDRASTTAAATASQTIAWPAPLGAAAYYGVFGDVVRAVEPQTEADPAAVLLHLLVMFGNVIGRTAHFTVGADTHYLNLFAGIVGRTAKGRKGMSRGESQRVFDGVDPDWVARCIAGGLSSGEGVIWAIRDPIEKKQPVKEGGRVVEYQTVIDDHGVSDKRLLFIESELASVLRVMAREGNTLSAVLRQAWDGQRLIIKTKNSPAVATNPHVSLIGHITADELLRYLQVTETANGFGNRFLWCCARRSKSLPDGGRPIVLDPYMVRFREAAAGLRDRSVELRRDVEARQLWLRVYDRLGAEIPGMLGAMTGRSEAQVMRLACLYAVADFSYVVRLPHLRAALDVWRYCFASAKAIFGGTLGDRVVDTILSELRRRHPESMTRTEITHGLFGRNLSSIEIDRAFQVLTGLGLCAFEVDRVGDGRPVERWYWMSDGVLEDRGLADDINDLNDKSQAAEEVMSSGSLMSLGVKASATFDEFEL